MMALATYSLPLVLFLLPLPVVYLVHSRISLPTKPVTEGDRRLAQFAWYGMVLVVLTQIGFIGVITYLPMFQGIGIPITPFIVDAPILGYLGWYVIDMVWIRERGLTKAEKIMIGGIAATGVLSAFLVNIVGLLPQL